MDKYTITSLTDSTVMLKQFKRALRGKTYISGALIDTAEKERELQIFVKRGLISVTLQAPISPTKLENSEKKDLSWKAGGTTPLCSTPTGKDEVEDESLFSVSPDPEALAALSLIGKQEPEEEAEETLPVTKIPSKPMRVAKTPKLVKNAKVATPATPATPVASEAAPTPVAPKIAPKKIAKVAEKSSSDILDLSMQSKNGVYFPRKDQEAESEAELARLEEEEKINRPEGVFIEDDPESKIPNSVKKTKIAKSPEEENTVVLLAANGKPVKAKMVQDATRRGITDNSIVTGKKSGGDKGDDGEGYSDAFIEM